MLLKQLHLKNFRCFSKTQFDFDGSHVLIEGANGSGKSSLLEAIHFACYLRSFRTHLSGDLVQLTQSGFFIKATMGHQQLDHEIQVGLSGKKRLVKVDQKGVRSYKELMDYIRVITLTEDDLALIKGGPEMRRSFIDQVILLYEPDFITRLKELRVMVNNRNALLQSGRVDQESYGFWTDQLLHLSATIQTWRTTALGSLQERVNHILQDSIDQELALLLHYIPKRRDLDGLLEQEIRMGRSLIGAHLDDFGISFQGKKSKFFASRGQQKLLILLLKIAQIKELNQKKGPALFLLDDFMTDFDQDWLAKTIPFLFQLNNQLIFTAPTRTHGPLQDLLAPGHQKIVLP